MQDFVKVDPIPTTVAKEAEGTAAAILSRAGLIEIKTTADFVTSGEFLKNIKTFARALEEKRKEITAPLDAAKKAVMDLFRGPLSNLESAEKAVNAQLVAYKRAQEEARLEQERKAREAAEAEERKKREALLKRAEKAEASGNEEKAAALKDQAEEVFIPRPIIQSHVPKLDGLKEREVWKFRILDPSSLPREYLIPDEKSIGSVVRATKGKCKIPGVEVFCEILNCG